MSVTKQIAEGICCLVTVVICCFRFYLRIILVRRYVWIEVPLIFALFIQIALLGVHIKQFTMSPAYNEQDIILLGQLNLVGAYLYLNALWAVKISVNLLHIRITDKFPTLNAWAVRSVYIIAGCWVFIMVTVPFGCFPLSRHWNGLVGRAKPCPNISRQWDFWTHILMHIITDLWLCILPFPALIQMREPRLRIAIFCVYGIAFCSVIVSIVRASLLGINAQSNADALRLLSMIEVSTLLIVGALPCISSAFTKKFVSRGTANKYSLKPVTATGFQHKRSKFSQITGNNADDTGRETNNSGSHSKGLATIMVGQAVYSSSVNSTENVIRPHDIKSIL